MFLMISSRFKRISLLSFHSIIHMMFLNDLYKADFFYTAPVVRWLDIKNIFLSIS